MDNTLTINDLLPLTNVTRKQVNNRVLFLKQRHPKFFRGGGRGRGGQYRINPFFTEYLTKVHVTKSPKESEFEEFQKRKEKLLPDRNTFTDLGTFDSFNWRWFGCYAPPYVTDPVFLTNLIPMDDGDVTFYSIHTKRKDDSLHIHFVLDSNKPTLSKPDSGRWIESDVRSYDTTLSKECFDYFTDSSLTKGNNQSVVEYGYLIGFKDRSGVKRIRI